MFSIQTLNNICTVNQFSCAQCQQCGFRITKCVVLLCVKEYFQQENASILCIFRVNTYTGRVFESVNGGSRRPLELITVGMSLHTPSPVKIIRCILVIRYCGASSKATFLNRSQCQQQQQLVSYIPTIAVSYIPQLWRRIKVTLLKISKSSKAKQQRSVQSTVCFEGKEGSHSQQCKSLVTIRL